MRVILFRGKRVDTGEWVEGNLVHQTEFYGDPVDRYHILSIGEFHCDYYDSYEVVPETVGQFTGFVDKNGRKIFEGDVFKLSNRHGTWFRVVKFDSISMVDMYGDEDIVDGYDIRFYLEATHLKVELVGNIHDNPELLKKVENL